MYMYMYVLLELYLVFCRNVQCTTYIVHVHVVICAAGNFQESNEHQWTYMYMYICIYSILYSTYNFLGLKFIEFREFRRLFE